MCIFSVCSKRDTRRGAGGGGGGGKITEDKCCSMPVDHAIATAIAVGWNLEYRWTRSLSDHVLGVLMSSVT